MEFIRYDMPRLSPQTDEDPLLVPCEGSGAVFYRTAEEWMFAMLRRPSTQHAPLIRFSGQEEWRHHRLTMFYGMVIDRLSAGTWELQDYKGCLTVRLAGEPALSCIDAILRAWNRLDCETVTIEYATTSADAVTRVVCIEVAQ